MNGLSMTGAAGAPRAVATANLTATLRLHQLLDATVLDVRPGGATLRLAGQLVPVTLKAELRVGQSIRLLVRELNAQRVTLQVLPSSGRNPSTSANVEIDAHLGQMGVEVTKATRVAAQALIDVGLPLTPGAVAGVLRALGGSSEPDRNALAAAAYLLANNLPPGPESLALAMVPERAFGDIARLIQRLLRSITREDDHAPDLEADRANGPATAPVPTGGAPSTRPVNPNGTGNVLSGDHAPLPTAPDKNTVAELESLLAGFASDDRELDLTHLVIRCCKDLARPVELRLRAEQGGRSGEPALTSMLARLTGSPEAPTEAAELYRTLSAIHLRNVAGPQAEGLRHFVVPIPLPSERTALLKIESWSGDPKGPRAPALLRLRLDVELPHLGPLSAVVTLVGKYLIGRLEAADEGANTLVTSNIDDLRQVLADCGVVVGRLDCRVRRGAPDEQALPTLKTLDLGA